MQKEILRTCTVERLWQTVTDYSVMVKAMHACDPLVPVWLQLAMVSSMQQEKTTHAKHYLAFAADYC